MFIFLEKASSQLPVLVSLGAYFKNFSRNKRDTAEIDH